MVMERRDTTWRGWCVDVAGEARLPHSMGVRIVELLGAWSPDERAAADLSAAYASRTLISARRALRAAVRCAAASQSTDVRVANASALAMTELLCLELREEEDVLDGLDRHGVDADLTAWSTDGPTLREPDGLMETRALLVDLLGSPWVRPDVHEFAQDVIDGVPPATFPQDVRRLWAINEGQASAEPPTPPSRDAVSTLLEEVRALRSEFCRSATPFRSGADWIEDVVSALPPLLDQADAAKALGVDPRTIRRMLRRGDLHAVDVGEGGRGRSCGVRVPRAAIAEFLRRRAARRRLPP